MIAKGTPHAHGARLGQYLVTGKGDEKAWLHELRGFAEDDIVAAFRSVHIIARATRCKQPFFHCQVRNPAGEHLSRDQWERVADRIERKLGLTDQPRAIAFHKKNGQEHMHVAWSRIDDETMTAKPLPFYKLRLKEVCRELEKELGLTRVRNQRDLNEPHAPSRAEFEEARRRGADLKEVRASIRQAWERSDTGHAFIAALRERGLALAQGERRDYVVVDQQGGLHALGKRLLGATAAETRVRMGDLDRNALATVGAARGHLAAARAIPIPSAGSPRNLFIRSRRREPDRALGLHKLDHDHSERARSREPGGTSRREPSPGSADLLSRWRDTARELLTPIARVFSRRKRSQQGGNHHGGRNRAREITVDYLRLCQRPLHNLRLWLDETWKRGGEPTDHRNLVPPQSRACMGADDGLRPLRGTGAGAQSADRAPKRPLNQRAGPMSRGELYEYFRRTGQLKLFFYLFPN